MIQIDKEYKYAWIWKILITWHDQYRGKEIWFGYYPDYENCKFWFCFNWGKD